MSTPSSNSRLNVRYTSPRFQAYNETFVDDDGVEVRWVPRCRRSLASSTGSWREPTTLDVLAPMIRAASLPRGRNPRPALPPRGIQLTAPDVHMTRSSNTAVIAPVMRSPGRTQGYSPCGTPSKRSAVAPLLRQSFEDSPVKLISTPVTHMPTELLCCVGFFLLASGIASTLLSFYIMSVAGRRYFVTFGAASGFIALLIGMFSFRTNKWKWIPHRNYITGYILVSVLSVLEACSLGGVVYAVGESSPALLDVLGGAVTGLSVLVVAGSLIGLVTSGCCHHPPPDNKVTHHAPGFIV